jgi:hypothetical protein
MLVHGVISLKTGTFFTLVLGSHSPVLVPAFSSLVCKYYDLLVWSYGISKLENNIDKHESSPFTNVIPVNEQVKIAYNTEVTVTEAGTS